MEEFKETEPVSTLPSSPPKENPMLEQQDAVELKDVQVVESGFPKRKRVLSETQKENLKLGRAIARKNREERAKAKLNEMVDNYLKPFANKEEEEKEPVVVEEAKDDSPPVPKLKRTKKTRPTSPYSSPEESEQNKESSDDYPLSSTDESVGWMSPPKKAKTWTEAVMNRAMTMPLPVSKSVKKTRVVPVKFI